MSAYDDAIFRRLCEAREKGEPVTLSEIKKLGGLYWEDCWARVKRRCAIGVKENAQGEPYFELGVEPVVERTASDQSSTGSGLVNPSGDDEAGLIPRASTDGSLSNEPGVERAGGMGGEDQRPSLAAGSLSPTQDTLFPASRPHYDDAREAA